MNNHLFVCENDTLFGFVESAMVMAENSLPDFIRSYFIVNDTNSIYYGDKDSIYKAVNDRGNSIIWWMGQHTDSFFISPDYFNRTYPETHSELKRPMSPNEYYYTYGSYEDRSEEARKIIVELELTVHPSEEFDLEVTELPCE